MCELDQVAAMPKVTRRQFGAMGAAGAVAACAPMDSSASATSGLVETAVSFPATGGTFDGVFIHPASGSHPAVILWPDIAGLRPAKIMMGRRLAEAGYAVLVANPYYRSVSGQQFEDFDAWREGGGFQTVGPWMQANTPAAIAETAGAVVAWLDAQDAVDTSRGIGNQGYCMTGSWTIRAAAAVPSRVKAAASFHGGGLVGEGPDAPVNLLRSMAPDAGALIAIARNDDAQAPTDKDALAAAGEAAAADVHVEVYDGDHGWTVLDSPVYAEAEAERAWDALLALYAEKL
ncbi:dienelactone hydrolase family protein [Aurantiacibacter gilvus]|uniref:Dienelactone hydrolase family protein n=1 Tax=Aurantiacibacter gilvus TaxID=3139141 RepID=A0ABU9I9F0_9SPHN